MTERSETWWEVLPWLSKGPVPVQVVRSTEQSAWVRSVRWDGTVAVNRRARVSEDGVITPSYADARAWMVDRARRALATAEGVLASRRDDLARAESLPLEAPE